MKVETVIHRIEEEMAQVSLDAMKAPSGRTEFDYGRAVGIYAGLDRAKELIVSLYRDVDERDRVL